MSNQAIWEKAAALLEDCELFNAERERVLAEWPRLNSGGMGAGGWKKSKDELEAARNKLQEGGEYEPGIFNTLEFFVTHEAYKKSPGGTRRRGLPQGNSFKLQLETRGRKLYAEVEQKTLQL